VLKGAIISGRSHPRFGLLRVGKKKGRSTKVRGKKGKTDRSNRIRNVITA